jgi:hypothetical protein
LIFDEVKGGFFATALLMATYGGASGKKWAFLAGVRRLEVGLERAQYASHQSYWPGKGLPVSTIFCCEQSGKILLTLRVGSLQSR